MAKWEESACKTCRNMVLHFDLGSKRNIRTVQFRCGWGYLRNGYLPGPGQCEHYLQGEEKRIAGEGGPGKCSADEKSLK